MKMVMNGLKHRNLSLADICPNWLEALHKGKTRLRALAIDKDRWCMVGEAWGFSNEYSHKCGECYRFCLEFTWVVSGTKLIDKGESKEENAARRWFSINSPGEFRELSREFVEHFNSEHKEEWYSRNIKL